MVFSSGQPKGEITLLIEGKADSPSKAPSEDELEHELRDLISKGHSISTSVKIVAEGTAVKRKDVYALALRLFAKPDETEESSNS
ncbi:16S rRNA (cytidine1402-2'-O)-methyltransferase [Dendrobium catenatum]|uniref:16S rRNA (Cytidine1402-2'-O)-methyltransferase n=1 Tax=Dendrobium catenatum TaxID=906689 RepID=A0A2I0WRY1_9ASPA|nr:16S rRNA (cytidine1402-2'-O)-methyltransferase [Dendrobium catenatum]